jgi:hypothetical protein
MVLTAYFVLSPVIGLSCHRRPRMRARPRPVGPTSPPRDLTPASRRQDHTTSPSASQRSRQQRRLRPPHPVPTSVTIAKRPSCGTGRRGYRGDLGKNGTGIFLQRGLDSRSTEQPVGQITHGPSLRATGSRECAPDDRLREAIHLAAHGKSGIFVASLLAMTWNIKSRHLAEKSLRIFLRNGCRIFRLAQIGPSPSALATLRKRSSAVSRLSTISAATSSGGGSRSGSSSA